MPRLNRRKSRSLSKKIPLVENRCFQNSYWTLRQIAGRACLVIGHARLFGFAVRHAWVEVGNTIIDPSWVGLLEKGDRPQYFAAHRYTKSQVKRLRLCRIGRAVREPLFDEWFQLDKEVELAVDGEGQNELSEIEQSYMPDEA